MAFTGFGDAKTAPSKPSKSAKPAVEEITIAGMEAVAALDVVIKSLTAIHRSKLDEVKDKMMSHFSRSGVKLGKRPENFRGVEGDASASCELRIRATSSPLTEDEIDLLSAQKIPTEVLVDTPATYIINPAYLTDMKVMGAVEEALKKAKGIPADLFQRQEEKSKTVVSKEAFDALFSGTMTLTDVEALLPVISVPAVKATLKDDSLLGAFKMAEKLLVPKTAKGA